MNKFLPVVAFLLLASGQTSRAKETIGWIEPVQVYPEEVTIEAKIDTGAEHSSLHATDVETFVRSDQDWARFRIGNRHGKNAVFEAPIYRTTKIKRNGAPAQKRFVVLLGICLDSVYKQAEVNLVDRGQYEYRMLVGRSFLSGDFVVDPANAYTTRPVCPPGQNPAGD